MANYKKIVFFTATVLCLGVVSPTLPLAGDVGVETLKSQMNASLKEQLRAQEKADQWSQEKASLINEIRQIKTRLDWHKYQNRKFDAYIEQEKNAISRLKDKKAEMRELRMKLEPYMDKLVDELDSFVQSDYTFLAKERRERIKFLRESMNDYHLDLDEKLRRILEAMQVEAKYGNTVEADSGTINIEGKTMQVDLLRIGRLARFYRSQDGKQVGRWSEEKQKWVELPDEYNRSIGRALEMANQKQAVKLVDLPIGGLD
ncbi:MAG: DUF3450 domain-containing protein, partial [Thermodesulfobacteriota bacterium]